MFIQSALCECASIISNGSQTEGVWGGLHILRWENFCITIILYLHYYNFSRRRIKIVCLQSFSLKKVGKETMIYWLNILTIIYSILLIIYFMTRVWPYSEAAKVIQPANIEDRLILIFFSRLDLELMKNAQSPKIWVP